MFMNKVMDSGTNGLLHLYRTTSLCRQPSASKVWVPPLENLGSAPECCALIQVKIQSFYRRWNALFSYMFGKKLFKKGDESDILDNFW